MRLLRSEVARWLLVSVAVLCLGVGGMLRTPGTAHSTWGEVAGFGFTMGSGECYLTVSYSVDGTEFRLRTPQQERWCDYSLASRLRGFVGTVPLPVLVYYDAAEPGSATLTPRGAVPGATALVGLAGVGAVGLCLLRRRRHPAGAAGATTNHGVRQRPNGSRPVSRASRVMRSVAPRAGSHTSRPSPPAPTTSTTCRGSSREPT